MPEKPTDEHANWRPSHSPWLIAISVMIPTFMEVLDTSIATVSLPHIAGSLSATTDESTWVLTSYLIANAIILPATNWLGNLVGRKKLLLACIIIFTIASACCGAAGDLGFLVLARILQGAGGGALQPISQAILLESFPPAKRGAAMALFAMGVVVAPIIGPLLGGWITISYSWRWIFYINLPIGALAWIMVKSFTEDPPYLQRTTFRSFDSIGFGFMAVWLGTMQYVLDKGQEADWFGSRLIVSLIIISVLAFLAFIIRELRAGKPIVNLRILKNRNFTIGILLMTALGAVLYGTTAILPLFLQTLLGYTSFDAGLALSPRGVGAFITTIIVGRIIGKVSNRWLMGVGFVVLAYSSLMLGNLSLTIGMKNVIFPTILNGIAISCIFVPLTTITMGYLNREQMGNAAGIFNLMRNLGGSIGIAAITTLVQRDSQTNQAYLANHINAYSPAYREHLAKIQSALSTETGHYDAMQKAHELIYGILQQQAHLLAYLDNFRLFGYLCFACLIFLFFFKGVRKKAKGRSKPVSVH